MKTYVLIGNVDESNANCLTEKGQNIRELIPGTTEIKKEFDAPSWEIARFVYDEYNGYCSVASEYIPALAAYYGYKVEKISSKNEKEAVVFLYISLFISAVVGAFINFLFSVFVG
jgi:hypothetical protein